MFKVKRFSIALVIAMFSIMLVASLNVVNAGIIGSDYFNDNFDSGFNADKWLMVNNEEGAIDFFGSAGSLRYNDPTGAEEVMITTNPLTAGENVIGYSVQFDFEYLTDDWGNWYAFAFNKTGITKGLDWGAGGYIFGRTSSLQTNNPLDTCDGPCSAVPGSVSGFAEMTPHIPVISFTNVTFKFVYHHTNQQLEVYYDLAGEQADLETLRNTFTLGALNGSTDYRFAIVSSGAGLYELDNLIIHQILDDETTVEYVNTAFDTGELPEQIQLHSESKFSYGPAQQLYFTGAAADARYITKDPFQKDLNVNKALQVNYDINLRSMSIGQRFGLIYGLQTGTEALADEGISYIYFVNRTVDEVTKTYIGATLGNGSEAVQKLNETILPANLEDLEEITMQVEFSARGKVKVVLAGGVVVNLTAGTDIGHFGFTSDANVDVLINNFASRQYSYNDNAEGRDLFNNFNTGYINPLDWEMDNYKDLRPGTDMPLVPSAQGIHVEDGKLVFDVAGESGGFFTKPSFTDFEMRFTLSDFSIPATPMNEDGEIDGIEIPTTFYVGVSMGHTSIQENPWNVSTVYFQSRDGGSVIYGLNVNDSTIYVQDNHLLMSGEQNVGIEWNFKIVAKGGTVSVWMKQSTDPIALFEEAPLVTFNNVHHQGRIAIVTSALGSFKIDDLSIMRASESVRVPIIEDEVNPMTLIAPVITVNTSLPILFETGSTAVDFKTYFTVNDNVNGAITITNDMLDLGGFNLQTPGVYAITLTVTDSHGNESIETIYVAVAQAQPETQDPIDNGGAGCGSSSALGTLNFVSFLLPMIGLSAMIGIIIIKKRP
jgi:hypothetical protein